MARGARKYVTIEDITDDDDDDYLPSSPLVSLSFNEYEAQRRSPVALASRDVSPDRMLDSDDIPLEEPFGLRHGSQEPPVSPPGPVAEAGPDEKNTDSDSSDDVPLAASTAFNLPPSSLQPPATPRVRGRHRSHSLPQSLSPRKPQHSPDIVYTPITARRVQNTAKAAKRRDTMQKNQEAREAAAEKKQFAETVKKSKFFDDLLQQLTEKGYTLVEFLDYVFDPANRLARDYRWGEFFQKRQAVLRILNYWCTSQYSKSARKLVYQWALDLVGKMVRREAKAITEAGVLRTMGRVINEEFFLSYRLRTMTDMLKKHAPNMFSIFRAISTTPRQIRQMTTKGMERKELLQGSAAIVLLKGASEKNSYPAAVNGTYLAATGGQRQHFGVFRSMGFMSGYTTIISPGDIMKIGSRKSKDVAERTSDEDTFFKSDASDVSSTSDDAVEQNDEPCRDNDGSEEAISVEQNPSRTATITAKDARNAKPKRHKAELNLRIRQKTIDARITAAAGSSSTPSLKPILSASTKPGVSLSDPAPDADGSESEHSRATPVPTCTNTVLEKMSSLAAGENPKSSRKRRKVPGILRQLSEACRSTARRVAEVGLFGCVYDNINLMFRVAEQILGRKNAQENGTCATIFPLFEAELDDMLLSEINDAILNAPPLTLENIELTSEEQKLFRESMIHTVRRIIVLHGGAEFERWKEELANSEPFSSAKISTHKTDIHPLPAMEIDEAAIVGNVEVLEAIYNELEVLTKSEDFTKYAKIVCGDQLTIARQRSIVNIRLGHEDGADSWQHVALMPGLFHVKLADCNAFMEMHFGKPNAGVRSPGGLAFHNTVLDRIPIILTSLPSFRVCRDLIMVSLYARVLHCLLLVSGSPSLEEYASTIKSFDTLTAHTTQIYDTYADADFVQELREMRAPEERRRETLRKEAEAASKKKKGSTATPTATVEDIPTGHVRAGDMVLENAHLFLRDGLITRLFADAIKSGDSGRVITVLKIWTYAFRGNNRSKYAHEMLHLIHNLVNVWPKKFRDIVIKNWLLNPTGMDNAFVEVDLVQEHLNFWIKKIYKADGDAHSWDWLAMVAPTVDVLRRLATSIHNEIGSRQGSKHSNPDLSKDIATLMRSLDELDVYRYKEGRVLDDEETPVPDAISVGLAALSHGSGTSPLSEFNSQFSIACARRRLLPVSSLLPFLELDNPLSDERLGGTGPSLPSDKLPGLPNNSTQVDPELSESELALVREPPKQPGTMEIEDLTQEEDHVVNDDDQDSGWEEDEGSNTEGEEEGGSDSGESNAEDGLVGVDEVDVAPDNNEAGGGWDSDDENDGGLFGGASGTGDDEDDFVGVDVDTDHSEGWVTD